MVNIAPSVLHLMHISCSHPMDHVYRYLSNYMANLFAGAWEPRDTSPLPVNIPMPSKSQGNDQTCMGLFFVVQAPFYYQIVFIFHLIFDSILN